MIKTLMIAYMVTCSLEVMVAIGMKVIEKRAYLLILLVNLLTNPVAHLLYYGMAASVSKVERYWEWSVTEAMIRWTGYNPVWILVEILVVLCEGEIYWEFREWIPCPWRYAVIANLISAMAGVLWRYLS